jgi:hypothetical protein
LIKERLNGKYRNDKDGFSKKFIELTQNVTYDKTKIVEVKPLFGVGGIGDFNNLGKVDQSKIYDELYADRLMISSEMG